MGKIWDFANTESWSDYRKIRAMREAEELMKTMKQKEQNMALQTQQNHVITNSLHSQKQNLKENTGKNKEREFCSVCGRVLSMNNVKGMCIECKKIVCNKCYKIHKKKIVCSDCIDKLKDKERKKLLECSWCKQEFTLSEKLERELEKKGKIKIICPYCRKTIICKY